jgi:bifunctional UDP-N-acetylglucosamine pyrophosphorylase/glucosamine-1-phosphate N-acetyltransferase
MTARAAVILAAGQGTRMKSPLPKMLHKVGGRTLLDRAIDAAEALGCDRIVVVVGAHSPAVGEHVEARLGPAAIAVQDPPLGSGHAVLAARQALAGFDGDVVFGNGDHPLMGAETLQALVALREGGTDIGVLGFAPEDPARFPFIASWGRLIADGGGGLERIVEAKDCSPQELAAPGRNLGFYIAPAGLLFELLAEVRNDNAQGEYYVTDIVRLARDRGLTVRTTSCSDGAVAIGVNSQADLATAEANFQAGRREALMAAGVQMPAPEMVHLSWDTEIAPGATVEPFVVFAPGVTVAAGAVIRAFSHLEGARVGEGALIGPYARLRPGAEIGPEAHIGNFVEVKKVKVGAGAKANHLAYLGDGSVGAGANIGAGTIFCNYDGFDKHETHVGEGAFIGSNTALVAPVSVGPGAYTGSGSVITKDVAADALGLERGPQVEKPGWAATFRRRKLAERAAKAGKKAGS